MVREISGVEELVSFIDLEDVFCQEERGRRIEWSQGELEATEFPLVNNSMGIVRDELDVRFRFRTVFVDREAEYVADWVALFRLPEPAEVDVKILHEFAERVAFFAVYPYIRASVYGSAARLNQPVPVLRMVRQGQFERGEEMTEEAANAAFGDVRSEVPPPAKLPAD